MACDSSSSLLYGAEENGDLITIDPLTGQGASVGPIGFDRVESLEFDARSGLLYGTDSTTRQLIRIDPRTGQGTAVGPTGYDIVGIAGPIQ